MKEMRVLFNNSKGIISYYTAFLPNYFYLSAVPNGDTHWGLIKFNFEGIELCNGITNRIAETDGRGRMKIIGVDLC